MPLSDRRKSVFVIGAGASSPFGYPMGSELTSYICHQLIPGSRFFQTVQEEIHDPKIIEEFRSRFFHSEVYSIDAFLKRTASKYPKYELIGKILIAMFLIQHEISENLFLKGGGEFHWLRHLFNILDDDLKGDWNNLPDNKFSFISFNYDRTLEHYLYMKLKNLYDFSDAQVNVVLSKLNIVHVHGHLGKLPFQSPDSRHYDTSCSHSEIMEAVASIRIAYETMGPNMEKELHARRIEEIVSKSNKLFFLGFSYHPDNMEILKLDVQRNTRIVFGSGVGMSSTRMTEIHRDHGSINGLENRWSIEQIMNQNALY